MRKVIGFCLLLAGLLLVFYPQIEKVKYDDERQRLIESFEQMGQTEFIGEVASSSEEVVAVESTDLSEEKNGMLEDAHGIIQINSIDLKMVMFEGATSNNLTKGIGMIEPKKEIGVNNIGLAGHRAIAKGKQFNRLDEVEEGDVIDIQTKDGVYEFVVTRSFVVHKSDVSVLDDADNPMITLVTCTPVGSPNPPDRLIVQAELKK